MKKIVFVLVVLLFTAPALATVTIEANQIPDTNQVVITYFSDGNLPRGFGLDITISDGNIVDCIAAMEGVCTDSVRGFGIFPSTIIINDQIEPAVISDAGNPVSTIQPALGGFDTNGVTVELGSLYQEPNSPPLGTELDPIVLCTLVVTADANCIVRIKGNAARCGEGSPALGVVMEDVGEIPDVIFVDCNYIPPPPPDIGCIPSDHPDYAEWVLMGEPNSWCGSGRQCHGDADGAEELIGKNWFWVGFNDLTVFLSGFQQGYTDPETHPWIAADFDHAEELIGKNWFRVGFNDLNIFLANFQQGVVPDDCLDVP